MKKKIAFDCLSGVRVSGLGLTDSEVIQQRNIFGPNEILERVGNPLHELFLDTLKDPMLWFLLGISLLFFILGDRHEAAILMLAIFPLLFMDAFLHWRTQASTAALKSQLSTRARVLRDGRKFLINSREIVPGDLVLLEAGGDGFLPADGIFQFAENLLIDESLLTGESLPVAKQGVAADFLSLPKQGEAFIEEEHLGFAGTRILTGRAQLRVLLTGASTSYGEIVRSVISVPYERTHLQRAIASLVRFLILVSLAFCVILAIVRIHQGHGWLDALLSAATLAVAAIPEEFPVVFSFFLGVGVYRLAKVHALVRKAVSVENIGRVTRICSDKTGTITLGQLSLAKAAWPEGLSERVLLETAVAASDPSALDPVDQAVISKAKALEIEMPMRESVFPFTEDRKCAAVIATKMEGGRFCFLKGAPELVLSKCDLPSEARALWLGRIEQLAAEGHKVLACARISISPGGELRTEPTEGYEFAGLLAFGDPPRAEVPAAIEFARARGIGVLMVTGDHPATAFAIAKTVKLGGDIPRLVSAEECPEKFSENWLEKNPEFLRNLDVVARCSPAQKLRIVRALKKAGEIVAVTGDGVNDVPALKAADIGIAMGLRGTRSAKEVSSIILSDDNFSTIVKAISEGQQLFANLRRSFEYLFLIHIPFVLSAALIPLLGYPLLYLPVHIVWLELVIHPTALLAFQQSATPLERIYSREVAFFSPFAFLRIVSLGSGFAAAILNSYSGALRESDDLGHARAKVLALVLVWSAGLVATLTRGRTGLAKLVMGGTLASGLALIQFPSAAALLHLAPLHSQDWFEVGWLVALFLSLQVFLEWLESLRTDPFHCC